MVLEWLFFLAVLLLPIAAVSGWVLGRRELAQLARRRDHSSQVATDYFMGLNYLLHDRPDKAIEVFIKALDVETETVETHLALGNLFRRRGEVDRAIRIHQNLVARSTLDVRQRGLALLELGLDYMRSGLFDRAENLFMELLDIGTYQPQALRHLIDIYQQEQDWHKALEYSTRLESLSGENRALERAHFYCEQAEECIARGARDEAQEFLDKALLADRRSVRASLMFANLAISARDFERALQHLKRIEQQDLAFLPEIMAPLARCYRALQQPDEFREYLTRLAGLRAGVSATLALSELKAEQDGLVEAKRYIVHELKIRPTIRGIERLVEYALHGAQGEALDDFQVLKETTIRLIAGKATYKCGHCGFSGHTLHWHCPGCKSWSTVKPIYGIEGE
jgi:lipopolysaccharide biosynthesis regulator YciM